MTIIDTLITNRVKGSWYSAQDLNRVGAAVEYLADRLQSLGYSVQVAPKTDWLMSDWPKATQLEQYRADIVTLRDALTAPPTMPQVPDSIRYMEYTDANDIETILVQLEQMLDNMAAAWFYTGDLYAGEI